ncbi:uncharacterized protein LOC123501994 isoform X3 [Portunus trituberculatus]|uniref:uncharacterized protein LOC123501994 isoform X3 n=1 Tax=Portunus trituberculatus TaxID=210409 RepID=UPI001E1CB1D8|nr:uncharacterized protein LOC123501994 isoform X3 [Portunus trituberculatus]
MEEFTFEEEEEEEEEEEILPSRGEMEKMEEQTRLLRQLYTETHGERMGGEVQQHSFSDLCSVPLSLTPGTIFWRGGMEEEEVEEEEDDEEEEVDMELKVLVPSREETQEMEEQNRMMQALLQDSMKENMVASASFISPSEPREPSHHTSQPQTSTTTFPISSTSTQSLVAEECGGQLEGQVEALLAQASSLDKALHLNLALQQVFKETIFKVEEALRKNREIQAEVKQDMEESGWSTGNVPRRIMSANQAQGRNPLKYSRLCIPYFKDAGGMPFSMNEDAKRKMEEGYIDLYTAKNRAWLKREQKTLVEAVEQHWKEQWIKHHKENIKTVERQKRFLAGCHSQEKEEEERKLEREMKKTEKALQELMEMPGKDVGPPPQATEPPIGNLKLDWEEIAAQAFDGVRTSRECQLMWDNLLHPSIYRGPWKEWEDLAIQRLVKIPDTNTNWDAIARNLDNGRTGYLVMQRWVSFILPTIRPVTWSVVDTKKLLDAVSLLRTGPHIPWAQVHQHLPGFTRYQIYNKWKTLNPEKKHNCFTLEEDFTLIKGLYVFGYNFESIASFLPGRSAVQAKQRFKICFIVPLTTKPWTRKEDRTLMEKGEVSTTGWKKLVMDLPRRTPPQMRARYLSLIVWDSVRERETERWEQPPPLFPLSLLTNKDKVKAIRNLMIKHDPGIKVAIDLTRTHMNLKEVLEELEEKRLAGQREVEEVTAQRMNSLMKKRGRTKGIPNAVPTFTPLRATLLKVFFAPGRCHTPYTPMVTEEITGWLCAMSDALSLRVNQRDQEEEEEEEEENLYISQYDRSLLRHLAKAQQSKADEERKISGGGGVRAASMPYLPPCLSTVGAMLSVIMQRPMLYKMSTGQFIFQNFRPQQLASMSHTQLTRIQNYENDELRIQATLVAQNSEGDNRASTSISCVPSSSSSSTQKAKIQELSGSEANKTDTGNDGEENEREEEEETDGSSNSQEKVVKIHITCGKSRKVAQFPTDSGVATLKKESRKPNFSTYIKGYSKTRGGQPSSNPGRQEDMEDKATAQAGPQEDKEHTATAQADPSTPAGPQEDTEHTATAQADPSTSAGPQEDMEDKATAQADPSTPAGPQEDTEHTGTAQADPSTPAGPQEDTEHTATAQADPNTSAGPQEDMEDKATAQADPSTPAGPQEDMEDKATAQAGPQEDTEHTATEQAGPSTTTTSLPWQNNTFALSSNTWRSREETQAILEEEERLQKARQRAEELLFQRMLSVFFWPTIMKLEHPFRWIVSGMEELVNKRKAHMKEERETVKRRRHAKDRETLEDSQYIRELVAKLRQEIEEKKNTKENLAKAKEAKTTQKQGQKRKRSQPEPTEDRADEKEEQEAPPPSSSSSSQPAPSPPPPDNTKGEYQPVF